MLDSTKVTDESIQKSDKPKESDKEGNGAEEQVKPEEKNAGQAKIEFKFATKTDH